LEVRLVGPAGGDGRGRAREGGAVALQGGEQLSLWRGGGAGDGQGGGGPPGGRLQPPQGVGGLGGRGRPGGAGGPATGRAWAILLVTASSPRRTWSAWMARVALVVSAVTLGLPSRSPPTQLPQRRYGRNGGAPAPLAPPARACSRAREVAGTSRNRGGANTGMTQAASCSGRR